MPYYPTIDDDLKAAKAILVTAKTLAAAYEHLPEPLQIEARNVGYITPQNNYAAYRLLHSFVLEIERLRGL